MNDPILQWIQKWYASRTDEEWEHQYGIQIETLDNPGWGVKIDVRETPWQYIEFSPINIDDRDDDWLMCEVRDGQFIANGDPTKLEIILTIFKNWILELQFTDVEKSLIGEICPSVEISVLSEPIAEISSTTKEQFLRDCGVYYRTYYEKYKQNRTKEAEEVLGLIGDICSKLR